MGWFSIPTLLLGYLTLKAQDLGLTRRKDRTGLLDNLLDKVKNTAATVHKRTIKMGISAGLSEFMNHITDYYRDMVEKITKQAFKRRKYRNNVKQKS